MNQLEGKIYAELDQLHSKMKIMEDSLLKIDDIEGLKVTALESRNVIAIILLTEKSYSSREVAI